MRVDNKTRYDTRFIRSLLTTLHKRFQRYYGPIPGWDRLVFEIGYGKWATFHGLRPVLRLPNVDPTQGVLRQLSGTPSKQGEVAVLAWNAWWVMQLLYKQQLPLSSSTASRLRPQDPVTASRLRPEQFRWLEPRYGEVVPMLMPKVKPKPSVPQLQEKRLANVLKLKKQWLRKRKLADTKLKKLTVRERYYKKVLEN